MNYHKLWEQHISNNKQLHDILLATLSRYRHSTNEEIAALSAIYRVNKTDWTIQDPGINNVTSGINDLILSSKQIPSANVSC